MRACSILLILAACGDDGGKTATDAPISTIDSELVDAAAPDARPFVCDASTAGGTHKLFLNFEGVTLTAGPDDATTNTTSWLGNNLTTATIPAWRATEADRTTKIQTTICVVREVLFAADIEVVTTRPTTTDYEMIVIGGKPQDIGHTQGVGALAGNDCAQMKKRDISWVSEGGGGNTPLDPVPTASLAMAVFGVGNALEPSTDPTNCMCQIGSGQGCNFNAQCSYAATSNIRVSERICGGTATTQDQLAKLVARYGARP